MRILVVDDEALIRKTIPRELQRSLSCEVVEAGSGEEAREYPLAPDVVVTDLCMPGVGGLDLIRFFRSRRTTKAIPIVAMSGAADSGTGRKALEAGASAYLDKPFALSELAALIEGLCGT